jgi:hypothetical protein
MVPEKNSTERIQQNPNSKFWTVLFNIQNNTFRLFWKAYLTHEIVKQDNCPAYYYYVQHIITMSNILLLCPAYYYYVQHIITMSNILLLCPAYYYYVQHIITMSNILLICPTYYYYVQHIITMSNILLLCPTYYYYVQHIITMSNTLLLCPTYYYYVQHIIVFFNLLCPYFKGILKLVLTYFFNFQFNCKNNPKILCTPI